MTVEQLKMTFIGMDSSDAIKNYASEKLGKHNFYLDKATSGDVVFKQNVHNRGVAYDFLVEVDVKVPKTVIHVEELGNDIYALIDKVSDLLQRRFKRYFEKSNQWEGERPWNVVQDNEEIEDQAAYSEYTPKIELRKKLNDMTPMEEAEAIEKMELLSDDQILFKHKSSGKMCMIYRLRNGNYGIIEPST